MSGLIIIQIHSKMGEIRLVLHFALKVTGTYIYEAMLEIGY